ncbi:MAG: tRNA(adenine34) deaminase [Bacillota bacterium]|nr:tRNA(adenine34) deaminase [Bacillota bacterium]MDK2856633.1 tRNA(adenine34) deaminase [Bacillota bacterium]MDK2925648.1 tRNA(adenine34) deaminase [Bacillota bacterium]
MTGAEDEHYMRRALELAREAAARGEVPVGAIVVRNGEIIAEGSNRREEDKDPTAHAELLAIRAAARALGGWRLTGTTLYVTLEPCAMCAGAIVLARVGRLVYGADDPKGGAVRTLYRLVEDERLNHRVQVTPGILAEECGKVLRDFFRRRREE